MMEFLNWAAGHPAMTVFFAVVVSATIGSVANSIGDALRGWRR